MICPAPKNGLSPWINASIFPSGESAGLTTESVKNVSCFQLLLDAGVPTEDRKWRNQKMPAASKRTTAALRIAFRIPWFRFAGDTALDCAASTDSPGIGTALWECPELESRFTRCNSTR